MENLGISSDKHAAKVLTLLSFLFCLFASVSANNIGGIGCSVALSPFPQDGGDSLAGRRVIPLRQVDVRPEFPGGRDAMTKYVNDFFRNDSAGGRALSYLSVKVRFIVEPDGSIRKCRIVDGATPDVDGKVLAMFSEMPRWTPGYKDGKAVRTGYGTRIRIPDYSGNVKTRPEFVGGRRGLMEYLRSELAKSGVVNANDKPVRLLTEFVVREDGSISDVRVIRHGTAEMDSVVLAVINGMPKWTPGTFNGKPVNVEYKLPVTFGTAQNGPDVERVDPEFPGGKEMLDKYIKENLRYPDMSADVKRSGKVVVRFVVDKDGSIVEPEILKHGTKDMDAEVLRFLSEMPRWNPGTRNGKPVRTRQTVTIRFNANETAFTKYDGTRKDKARRHAGKGGRKIVYVIDGKEVEKHVFDRLDAKKIKTVEPVRPREARRLYGEKAADGAIVVTTVDPEF